MRKTQTVQRKGVINYNADGSLYIKGSGTDFQSRVRYILSMVQPCMRVAHEASYIIIIVARSQFAKHVDSTGYFVIAFTPDDIKQK